MSMLVPLQRRTTFSTAFRAIRCHQAAPRRDFVLSCRAMLEHSDLSISSGEDKDQVLQQATSLVDSGKWQLCNSGKGLERAFKFKTFNKTWDFMNQVAAECKKTRHHPEWSNVYNKTHIRWTTHNPEGLSSKDTHMAKFCDDAAREYGELEVEPGEGKVGSNGKIEAGDCCGGKPKAR